jgi:hypothetical protein
MKAISYKLKEFWKGKNMKKQSVSSKNLAANSYTPEYAVKVSSRNIAASKRSFRFSPTRYVSFIQKSLSALLLKVLHLLSMRT